MRNRKISHDYNISISVVIESKDIEEAEEYADALMEDILGDDGVVNADWYAISAIRKYRPKRKTNED